MLSDRDVVVWSARALAGYGMMSGVTTPPPPAPPPTGPPAPAPLPPGSPDVPTSPSREPFAEFRPRLRAFVLDILILGGVAVGVIVPLYLCLALVLLDPVVTIDGQVVEGAGVMDLLGSLGLLGLGIALTLALAYAYHVEVALRRGGQTFGKRIAGLRVVSVDSGEPPTRRQLAIRLAAQMGLGVVPGLNLVDGFSQLWDKPHRQCLHDKAAATAVVRLDS